MPRTLRPRRYPSRARCGSTSSPKIDRRRCRTASSRPAKTTLVCRRPASSPAMQGPPIAFRLTRSRMSGRQLVVQQVGQDAQPAAVVRLQPLRDRNDGRTGPQQRPERVRQPAHAERVHPADDEVRALERPGQLLHVVRHDAVGQLSFQRRVPAPVEARPDDRPIQMCADQAHVVPVVRQRPGYRRPHQPRAQNRYLCHAVFSPWKASSTQRTKEPKVRKAPHIASSPL